MTIINPICISHVRQAVACHDFLDSCDWAVGISELADLSDDAVEHIAEDANTLPSIFRRPSGISRDQAQRDRALFVRC